MKQHAHVPVHRFDRCLGILMQRTRIYPQQPSFLYFPQLAAIEFHDRARFPWLDSIEAATDDIRAAWREGVPYPEHLARCPRTVAALASWPRCEIPGSSPSAVFSILDSRTRIPPHHGVNNTRLIVHLPLIVPPGCVFRVGGETREWEPGKAFVFDDTIEHEAWNRSSETRVILLFDVWRPELSQEERALVVSLFEAIDAHSGGRKPDWEI